MNLLKFVPIKLSLFLILGILIGHYFEIGIQFALTISLFFILFLWLLFRKSIDRNSILFGSISLLTTTCIGLTAVALWYPKNHSNHYSKQNIKQEQIIHLKVEEVLKSSTYSDRYMVRMLSINKETTTGVIVLSIPSDTTQNPFYVDDELITFGKFSEISPALNPHQFNYKKYLENLGIYHQLRVKSDAYTQIHHNSKTIYGIAASIRNKINFKLEQANFGIDELGIIQALLLGERKNISEETYTNFKNAGAVHILALSGLHIGIILLILQYILRPIEFLPKGKTIKLVTIVLLLWSFALVAGFSSSVVRAVTMYSFIAYSFYLNRPSNTFNILALSMFFILLLINPMLIFQAGFQMSYAAVFAIVWLYPVLQRLVSPKNIILKKGWQLFSVSIAAQLGVLPISLFYFHQFPGLFFISNIVIVPSLGIILGTGIIVIILALLNYLPELLVVWYNAIIKIMLDIIRWTAQQEAFIFNNISFDITQLILVYLLIIALIQVYTKATYRRVSFLLFSIIGLQAWLLFSIINTSKKESLFVIHQSRNTVLMHQKGNILEVRADNYKTAKQHSSNYQIAERIKTIKQTSLRNTYTFKGKHLTIIDSTGVYFKNNTDYILLTQSPKINLDRLLDTLQPVQIIADGSNYKSYINRWKETCKKRKLPFHYTGEKGAYYFIK